MPRLFHKLSRSWPANFAPPYPPDRPMPTETLHFENARVAQQLFDNNTQNLRALEENLGVKATSREGWIKLEGPTDGVDRAKRLFQLLESSLKSGAPVRSREFSQ